MIKKIVFIVGRRSLKNTEKFEENSDTDVYRVGGNF